MKKTYRTLVSLVMCAAMAGGTCLPAAAGESFTDSIGINRTEGYTYDPEEVMYLSGVRADYYASANYDWLSQAHVKNQGDSVDQTAQYVSANDKEAADV